MGMITMKENKPVIGVVQRQEDNYLSTYFDAINKMGGIRLRYQTLALIS